MRMLQQFIRDDAGSVTIEYAMIATLISIAVVGAALAIGGKTASFFASAAHALR